MPRRIHPSRGSGWSFRWTWNPASCNFLRSLFCGTAVALVSHSLSHFAISFRLERLPGLQTVHVAVVHAEGRGDQNGIVNLLVGRALAAGAVNGFGAHILAGLLHL